MVLNTSSPVNVRLIDPVIVRFRTTMRSYNLWQVLRFFVSVTILFSWGWNCLSVFDHFVGLALKGLNLPTRAYTSSLLRAIIACNHMPLFKVFSNFVHLAQITFKITLPFFWKRIGPVNITAPIKSSQFAIYELFYYFNGSEISRYCWITNCFSFLSFFFFHFVDSVFTFDLFSLQFAFNFDSIFWYHFYVLYLPVPIPDETRKITSIFIFSLTCDASKCFRDARDGRVNVILHWSISCHRSLSIPNENIRKPLVSDAFRGFRKRPVDQCHEMD